jgi:gliding motility-associated-like protein
MNIRVFTFGIILLVFSQICNAQTCTGSLGDPVIKIDFGSGAATIGPALGSGITTYAYATGTPNDGEYTIANTTNGMHPGNWWPTTDHTGNTSGYMMVVNASFNADVFYTQTITGLCPGTTYEFAAWVMNLLTYPGIKPNLTFTVKTANGATILQQITTGNITESSSPTWKQYGLTFTVPITDNSVIIQISNNANGGNGNDLALDDITFRPCGPLLTAGFGSATSSTYNNCTANVQKDTLNATVSTNYVLPQYQWQVNTGSGWTDIAGATSTQYIFNQPAGIGNYQYRLASADGSNINSANCQVRSNIISLTVTQSPTATANSNGPTVCEGTALTLSASGGSAYKWTDPNGNQFSTSQNPVINNITPAQAGKYTVTVGLSGSPCTSQASVTIAVQPKITATVSPDVAICEGTSTPLQASGGISYKWTPSVGLSNDAIANPDASPTVTTAYTVTATNANCSSTASVTVTVIKKPAVSAGGDKKIVSGQSVVLNGSPSAAGLTYLWTPAATLNDPTSLTPIASPTVNTRYTLQVTSPCGTFTDSAMVKVYKAIVVPTAFSPNADGINDSWDISGLDAYTESVLSVYTRNGQMIYTTTGYSKPWDGTYNGKPVPVGTYYYIIDLKNIAPTMSGYVTVVK